jgi:hypothetical protein
MNRQLFCVWLVGVPALVARQACTFRPTPGMVANEIMSQGYGGADAPTAVAVDGRVLRQDCVKRDVGSRRYVFFRPVQLRHRAPGSPMERVRRISSDLKPKAMGRVTPGRTTTS